MSEQELPLFDYDEVQIGEELGSYEYLLTRRWWTSTVAPWTTPTPCSPPSR